MIYRWFNWTPVYGISHDTFHNVVLFVVTLWATACVGIEAIYRSPFLIILLSYFAINCFSLMAEVVFAALFLTTRGKGADKIYFAADTPEYRLINGLTRATCWIVYTHMILMTVALFWWGRG
jgi:hypothetical protein